MGILLARILEWVAMPSSRASFQPRDQTLVFRTLQAVSLSSEPPGKPKNTGEGSLSLLHGIFPTQESNWGILQYRQILYQLSYHSGMTSFRTDWLDLLEVQGTLESILQPHSLIASILQLSAFFIVQVSHPYMNNEKISFDCMDLCQQSDVSAY